MKKLIKICGMSRQEDLDYAAELGVDMCGFIFAPKSLRYVQANDVALLNSYNMLRVGVFVSNDMEEIKRTVTIAKLDLIQLHGKQDLSLVQELEALYGEQKLVYVIWPEAYATYEAFYCEVQKFKPYVTMFLLDAGLSSGGSGQQINSNYLYDFTCPKKYLLAGGLNPNNIAEILKKYKPSGLDFNSGLEDKPAHKNKMLMQLAVENVRFC